MMTIQEMEQWGGSLPSAVCDHPFDHDFDTTVLRHRDSGKWFGLTIRVSWNKLGLEKEGSVKVINLKCAPEDSFALREIYHGILPAYHMNKLHWITVIPDMDVSDPQIKRLIEKSYTLTKGKKK